MNEWERDKYLRSIYKPGMLVRYRAGYIYNGEFRPATPLVPDVDDGQIAKVDIKRGHLNDSDKTYLIARFSHRRITMNINDDYHWIIVDQE